ncbi:MAG: organomercurial lyase [bacterium]|jgi:hypothetical protein
MEDIGGLAEYIAGLGPREKAVRRAAFLALRTGRPAALTELSWETGLPPAEVRAAARVLSDKGLAVCTANEDAIIGAGGLSLRETCHRLRLEGVDLYTWCAADAVGIPAALAADAVIASACHTCGEPVTLIMDKGKIAASQPPDTRVWVVEADTSLPVSGHT